MLRIPCWRVFPYDETAAPGEPFTSEFAAASQGAGRFDIPDLTPVLYLAETPVHAVAEVVQGLRNQQLDDADLARFGHRLALTSVTIELSSRVERSSLLPDLCEPRILARYDIRPDRLASSDFAQTQAAARRLFAEKCLGFRWWSSLSGDWHTIVIFKKRLRARSIHFGTPEQLTLRSEAVLEAARRLGIHIRKD